MSVVNWRLCLLFRTLLVSREQASLTLRHLSSWTLPGVASKTGLDLMKRTENNTGKWTQWDLRRQNRRSSGYVVGVGRRGMSTKAASGRWGGWPTGSPNTPPPAGWKRPRLMRSSKRLFKSGQMSHRWSLKGKTLAVSTSKSGLKKMEQSSRATF